MDGGEERGEVWTVEKTRCLDKWVVDGRCRVDFVGMNGGEKRWWFLADEWPPEETGGWTSG